MIEIRHQLEKDDFFYPKWKLKHVFIGTFNPAGGKKVNYFYGRPRNRAWELLSNVFKLKLNVNDSDFLNNIQEAGIACMDMISSISINNSEIEFVLGKGYNDSKIINNKVKRIYNTENIINVIKRNPGIKIYSTWGKGSKLKDWVAETSKIQWTENLVSPSMAAKVEKGTKKFPYMLNNWKQNIIL